MLSSGLVVSVSVFYTDDPSSNPTDTENIFLNKCIYEGKRINEQEKQEKPNSY